MSKVDGPVTNAEREIVKILRELEERTGQRVEEISLYRMDITIFDSAIRQFRQSVRIELARPVENRWVE